jgi:hypothetical protein
MQQSNGKTKNQAASTAEEKVKRDKDNPEKASPVGVYSLNPFESAV